MRSEGILAEVESVESLEEEEDNKTSPEKYQMKHHHLGPISRGDRIISVFNKIFPHNLIICHNFISCSNYGCQH